MTTVKKLKQWVIDPCIHVSAWIIGYQITIGVFSGSECVYVYGLLSGWWCALYLGYIGRVKLFITIPLIIIYMTLEIVSFFWELPLLLYHNPPANFEWAFFFVILGQAVIFISPIPINIFVQKCASWLKRTFGKKFA